MQQKHGREIKFLRSRVSVMKRNKIRNGTDNRCHEIEIELNRNRIQNEIEYRDLD